MKTAIIIGASSGIGLAIAEILLSRSYRIGITARRIELLASLGALHPERVYYQEMDVREYKYLAGSLNALKHQLVTVDLLVISAGVGELNPALEFAIEKDMIDTNVVGFTAIADWAFNTFRDQGFGTLAAITSIAALRGNGDAPGYSATKAFQVNYLEGLRHKAFKVNKRIHIVDLRPGFVDTKMAKNNRVFWVCPVSKAAQQMITGIDAGTSVVYISRRWRIIGWILKLLPRWIHKRI